MYLILIIFKTIALGIRHKLVAMPVLHPDDQTALNESELDMEESVEIPPPVEIH